MRWRSSATAARALGLADVFSNPPAVEPCATLSHMEIGVRELRNQTSRVIDAVEAGERVVLTVRGEPVADIVPHGRRARWLGGERLRARLTDAAADPALTGDLDELAGSTLAEL